MSSTNHVRREPLVTAAPVARFSVSEVLKDCTELGLLDELRAALVADADHCGQAALRAVRDLIYELASAPNKDLAVDALIYATGIAEFERTSLRSCAQRHGLTPEGFRQHVLAIQRRLHLPARPLQRHAA